MATNEHFYQRPVVVPVGRFGESRPEPSPRPTLGASQRDLVTASLLRCPPKR